MMYCPYFLLRKAITSWMFSLDTKRYRYGLKGRDTLNLRVVEPYYSAIFARTEHTSYLDPSSCMKK